MSRRDRIIINKILSEIDVAVEMMGETSLSDFLNDEKLKRAVCMTVINIGELIKNVSEETRKLEPNIPWKAIAGMRDLTAHKYQTLRMEDVYSTVNGDFSELKESLLDLLERLKN